nr:imelysin family protein [Lutibaculum baratangense]
MLVATAAHAQPALDEVAATYADIAQAGYEDSLTTAETLKDAVAALVADPSEETLAAARQAWIDARVPYQQTEVYRFGNPLVDEWEGKVNAWPLDEGLIDYVDASYGTESDQNEAYAANVIANPQLKVGGREVDASTIDADLLEGTLQELGGVEANVATGYHAVEFLLWGQDLNGTDAGAGDRPHTDYVQGDGCTGGNCDRRAQYLTAATELLVSDLREMAEMWAEGGEARAAVTEDPEAGVRAIFTGMGSLSYGELAGERMKLGLMLHDPEEEHDCFSDNTHNSHYYDALGIRNVYVGRYVRTDGSVVEGPAPADLVEAAKPETHAELLAKLDETLAAMDAIRERAEGGEAYDQMIGEGNEEGNEVVQHAVDALIAQTRSLERAIAALDLEQIDLEGSDSLDNPNAVFQ